MPKTVFVVGAGASSEFGLPLGSALAAEIRSRLQEELRADPSHPRPLFNGAMMIGDSRRMHGDYGEAARDLASGLVSARSVDRLLDSRSDRPLVGLMGKYAIARVIAEREAQTWLSMGIESDWDATQSAMTAAGQTWIGSLFSMLQEGVRPDDAETIFADVSFVTFNYDRLGSGPINRIPISD
jgi:hypothetical protein